MGYPVHRLRWADIDPTGRTFDPAPARQVAERVIGDADLRGPDREALGRALDQGLLAAYGAWVSGWSWAASEPGGGGLIRGWCCPDDSILREDEAPAATVERVVAAVGEWWTVLGELSRSFDELRQASAGFELERAVEHAAARLVTYVVERTSAEDAWYSTFDLLLRWHLEALGVDSGDVRAAITRVVSGRFESWIAPGPAKAAEAATELGLAVAIAAEPRELEPRDALAQWIAAREQAFTSDSRYRGPAKAPVREDGHRAFIEAAERARDPARADRMAAALDACRASAARGEPLTFERLAAWQALVLGRDVVSFRTGDALAKDGREGYPLHHDTERRFRAALAETEHAALPATTRAARAYLDVCFFHPFEDGNARAARLALDHVLSRAGLALHAVEPLFTLARAADDAHGAWSFGRLVEHLTGLRP